MSESEGLHHFKFLYQRFLTSTLGWPEDAQMGYVKLLIVQFERGYIPSEMKEIAIISPAAKKHWKKIGPKFTNRTEDGHLFNWVMDGIRTEAIAAYTSSVENGKKGGRPKKTQMKPAGSENNNPNGTGGFSTGNPTLNPLGNPTRTSNEEPVVTPEEGESVNTRADLSKSNLFRRPVIPTIEQVTEAFARAGGTEEMAQRFFDSNQATDWYWKGSPITNFVNLVPGFIKNWRRNDGEEVTQPIKNQKSVIESRTEEILDRFE